VVLYTASPDRLSVVTTCIAPLGLALRPMPSIYRTHRTDSSDHTSQRQKSRNPHHHRDPGPYNS